MFDPNWFFAHNFISYDIQFELFFDTFFTKTTKQVGIFLNGMQKTKIEANLVFQAYFSKFRNENYIKMLIYFTAMLL